MGLRPGLCKMQVFLELVKIHFRHEALGSTENVASFKECVQGQQTWLHEACGPTPASASSGVKLRHRAAKPLRAARHQLWTRPALVPQMSGPWPTFEVLQLR